MPEVLTKYPELLLREFKDAGISCGGDVKKQILRTCPNDRFCRLPTGEICVYGLKEIPTMTQINGLDVFLFPEMALSIGSLLIMIFLIGVILGLKYRK